MLASVLFSSLSHMNAYDVLLPYLLVACSYVMYALRAFGYEHGMFWGVFALAAAEQILYSPSFTARKVSRKR